MNSVAGRVGRAVDLSAQQQQHTNAWPQCFGVPAEQADRHRCFIPRSGNGAARRFWRQGGAAQRRQS